jgi:hypothetical protein
MVTYNGRSMRQRSRIANLMQGRRTYFINISVAARICMDREGI